MLDNPNWSTELQRIKDQSPLWDWEKYPKEGKPMIKDEDHPFYLLFNMTLDLSNSYFYKANVEHIKNFPLNLHTICDKPLRHLIKKTIYHQGIEIAEDYKQTSQNFKDLIFVIFRSSLENNNDKSFQAQPKYLYTKDFCFWLNRLLNEVEFCFVDQTSVLNVNQHDITFTKKYLNFCIEGGREKCVQKVQNRINKQVA